MELANGFQRSLRRVHNSGRLFADATWHSLALPEGSGGFSWERVSVVWGGQLKGSEQEEKGKVNLANDEITQPERK
jgi:hypothetical protein